MKFLPVLQTAAYTASIAAIVTIFTAAKSACLNVQESRRHQCCYQSSISYERFEFNLDDWSNSLIVRRLWYAIVKLGRHIYTN